MRETARATCGRLAPMTPTPPEEPWRPSERALRYWSAILVVVLGVICGAVIPGTLGGTVCTIVVGLGLIGVVSMIFYDVGLTEDRERAKTQERERIDRELGRRRTGAGGPEGASGNGLGTAHDRPRERPGSDRLLRPPGRLRDGHRRSG